MIIMNEPNFGDWWGSGPTFSSPHAAEVGKEWARLGFIAALRLERAYRAVLKSIEPNGEADAVREELRSRVIEVASAGATCDICYDPDRGEGLWRPGGPEHHAANCKAALRSGLHD